MNCLHDYCENEATSDAGYCEYHDRKRFDIAVTDGDAGKVADLQDERRAMLAGFAGYGPGEDGADFTPMSDDEMAFAQKRWEFELSTPQGAAVLF